MCSTQWCDCWEDRLSTLDFQRQFKMLGYHTKPLLKKSEIKTNSWYVRANSITCVPSVYKAASSMLVIYLLRDVRFHRWIEHEREMFWPSPVLSDRNKRTFMRAITAIISNVYYRKLTNRQPWWFNLNTLCILLKVGGTAFQWSPPICFRPKIWYYDYMKPQMVKTLYGWVLFH